MRYRLLPIAILLTILSYGAAAQTQRIKTGWNVGPFPCVGYSSDLGFEYGVLVDLYHYGDGSIYPGYRHKISAQAAWFTKGSGLFHLLYDSKYLIPGIRLTTAVSYVPNKMASFYGFNGYAAAYDRYVPHGFYAIDRNMFRFLADFQGNIVNNLQWAAGIAYYNYALGHVKEQKYAGLETLYDLYRRYGIISDKEAAGGQQIEFKAGLVYDTRDREADPFRGIWAEAVLYGSPDMIGRHGIGYLKLSASFRHYIPLVRDKLTLAYRISYQGTVAGNPPFYTLSNLSTLYLRQISYEGLGGGTSLRGMLPNRVVGNGFAWGNVEIRYRFFHFRLLNQFWYFALNPFLDMGAVVQPYRLQAMKNSRQPKIYSGQGERLHVSAGVGGKLVMNDNFVLSAEWGFAFDRRDGTSGLELGLNYLF